MDVPRFLLRSCTCPRAIRSCGIIEFHWIRSVPADRIDDCIRELLLRNSSDRGYCRLRDQAEEKDKPDHLEDGWRIVCVLRGNAQRQAEKGVLRSIRFDSFWLLHRHAKREIYVVSSLGTGNDRPSFYLPRTSKTEEERERTWFPISVFSLFFFLITARGPRRESKGPRCLETWPEGRKRRGANFCPIRPFQRSSAKFHFDTISR